VCVGVFMIVADSTVVVVALPSIKFDLGFSDASLVWVVNAYLVTYAGFLLLCGRLGDLFEHRRLFLIGLMLFSVASLCCALPRFSSELIVARAMQGLAGAMVTTTALSLVVSMFEDPVARARALGIYGFACSAGGAGGLLLSGVLTSLLSWRWIFLVNLPIGAAAYVFSAFMLPAARGGGGVERVDLPGAIIITSSLVIAIYAIVNANRVGWGSVQTLGSLSIAATLLALFIAIETHTRVPLVPAGVFRIHNLVICCIISGLLSAATSAAIIASLYLQRVLGYDPIQVGLAFLPGCLITGAFSLGLSARVVIRFGVRRPLLFGLLVTAGGLTLLARSPVRGSTLVYVLPGLILLGLGSGLAFNPMIAAAMNSVARTQSGLASGVISTCSTMGGALGLAVLVSLSEIRTKGLLSSGVELRSALNAGYHIAFIVGAACAIGGAGAIALLHAEMPSVEHRRQRTATLRCL
jgi:EmrB/QacA subfamily drug resistance transporter